MDLRHYYILALIVVDEGRLGWLRLQLDLYHGDFFTPRLMRLCILLVQTHIGIPLVIVATVVDLTGGEQERLTQFCRLIYDE